MRAACLWLRVAVQSGENEEVRRMLCQEVYGWIERAMRWSLYFGIRAPIEQYTLVK